MAAVVVAAFESGGFLFAALPGCRYTRIIPALVENRLRYVPFEIFNGKNDYKNVVHLADDWKEVRNQLDGTDDVEKCARGNHLCMPGHPGVGEGPADDSKLFNKFSDRSAPVFLCGLLGLLFAVCG